MALKELIITGVASMQGLGAAKKSLTFWIFLAGDVHDIEFDLDWRTKYKLTNTSSLIKLLQVVISKNGNGHKITLEHGRGLIFLLHLPHYKSNSATKPKAEKGCWPCQQRSFAILHKTPKVPIFKKSFLLCVSLDPFELLTEGRPYLWALAKVKWRLCHSSCQRYSHISQDNRECGHGMMATAT